MIDTSLAMSQYPDERTNERTSAHFPPRGCLITQHGAIRDSHRIRGTFGVLLPQPSAKDGHRHVLKSHQHVLSH